MNTSNIKKYAPKARREFMEAVAKRLNSFGISQTQAKGNTAGELQVAEAIVQGSVLQIDGNSFDSALAEPRRRLVALSEQMGFEQLVEQGAYTWFNRLCAIRYMEIHDYLWHGLRVLSHPDNPTGFEIIDHAVDAADELDLDRNYIIELKLAGNKDETLYRRLLLKQCHKLHEAMPFLFEALNDATELLLPDNLTRTDSILRGLVDSIPEEDWDQVEVIGWLYQFYISEKKDEVMGKVVKSEDIPAATQLFTPNWIVKYLVQNSVGRQWLQTYPESAIKTQMEYYIEPAEQSSEVNEQLQAMTPDSIDPESIKVLDPAVGSGHILIEAYNVLKAIYEERGFRPRDIPKTILENNLYGLDIDDRAAQLSGFALMMLARADDKRIFTRHVSLNVLALQEGNHINLPAVWRELNLSGGWDTDAPQDMFADDVHDLSSFEADNRYQLLQRTLARFTQAKTFGSLIEVPADEYDDLKEMHETLLELAESGDSFQRPAAKQLIDIVYQALILSIRYDAVIANPPYMGSNNMNSQLRSYLSKFFEDGKSDLYAAFIIRLLKILNMNGNIALMTPFTWMNLSSYEKLRTKLLENHSLRSLIQPEYHSFFESAYVPICAFCIQVVTLPWKASFIDLSKFYGEDKQAPHALIAIKDKSCTWRYERNFSDFLKVPKNVIAYSLSNTALSAFDNNGRLSDYAELKQGLITGDNNRYLRFWHEVSMKKSSLVESQDKAKWFPYQKGGAYRKWYGNNDYFVNWQDNGIEIRNFYNEKGKLRSRPQNIQHFFKRGFTWTSLTISPLSMRHVDGGHIFDAKGPMCFPKDPENYWDILGYSNSVVISAFLKELAPTMDYSQGPVGSVPYIDPVKSVDRIVKDLVLIAQNDWNSHEISWDFKRLPIVNYETSNISEAFNLWKTDSLEKINIAVELETENNKIFIETYDLEGVVFPDVNRKNITLSYIERSRDLPKLISYCLGCVMGRYSLDREGLVYANSGNEGFDELVAEGAYKSFPADQNAIIPLTDQEWFKDDATDRLREFVQVVWGSEHLQENLDFIAESLCLHAIKPKKSESALETIRRYLSTQFYKDHLKTYKKRPIYWLFSSGKNKAFECLVYLHRYNEGTLSRMRTEYVTPLLGKYDAYAEQLDKQIENAESTSDTNRFKKELAVLVKQQVELREFDDKLKHYADMRISLDLDDGVKVNYGKFGDLLSDVKSITGSAPEVI